MINSQVIFSLMSLVAYEIWPQIGGNRANFDWSKRLCTMIVEYILHILQFQNGPESTKKIKMAAIPFSEIKLWCGLWVIQVKPPTIIHNSCFVNFRTCYEITKLSNTLLPHLSLFTLRCISRNLPPENAGKRRNSPENNPT